MTIFGLGPGFCGSPFLRHLLAQTASRYVKLHVCSRRLDLLFDLMPFFCSRSWIPGFGPLFLSHVPSSNVVKMTIFGIGPGFCGNPFHTFLLKQLTIIFWMACEVGVFYS